MKRGDVVIFKRSGFISFVIGSLIKFFEKWWDFWGWHMAVVWQEAHGGWYILEAMGQGVKINYYTDKFLAEKTRIYTWLDEEPTEEKMGKFLAGHINKRYDVAIYFWTALQYLIRHYFNHRIPRLLDERFTCWELAFAFCEEMGKPIGSKYDCPIITDFLKVI